MSRPKSDPFAESLKVYVNVLDSDGQFLYRCQLKASRWRVPPLRKFQPTAAKTLIAEIIKTMSRVYIPSARPMKIHL